MYIYVYALNIGNNKTHVYEYCQTIQVTHTQNVTVFKLLNMQNIEKISKCKIFSRSIFYMFYA